MVEILPPLEEARVRTHRKIIQHMKRFSTNITIWEANSWSKELREALIKILHKYEVYEAHVAELQPQAFEAFVASATFSEDMLLLFLC